jgi:hypothetical protein
MMMSLPLRISKNVYGTQNCSLFYLREILHAVFSDATDERGGKKETGEGAKLHATLFTTLLSLSRAEYDSFRMLNVDVTLGSLSKVV